MYQQRLAQFTALASLRRIQREGVDDSEYIHALSHVDLHEHFRDITAAETARLNDIATALKLVELQSMIPVRQMRAVLTPEQLSEYVASFDRDLSHIECDESDQVPWPLQDYMEQVRRGDRYTRIANMFKHSTKRDARGQTARGRYEDKAFGCYEEAVADLLNCMDPNGPDADPQLAGQLQRWLDREVSTKHGHGPDISAQGVPRLRGSRSRYALTDEKPVVGSRLRKHWRQREALSQAALLLLYHEPQEHELNAQQLELLQNKLRQMRTR